MNVKSVQTVIRRIDPDDPENNAAIITQAADIIKRGGLVAFPTETVYGLGADATNAAAVKKIYAAKGRPSDNPLIIHIASVSELAKFARDIPERAYTLADVFWPGPLTMVLHKNDSIPPEATGGLDTAAFRAPADRTARLIIRAAGVPVAAPSSNASGRPSATDVKHVASDLYGRIDMIIDGGPSPFGLESTVCDLTADPPAVLRPGCITYEELLGTDASFVMRGSHNDAQPKSPGMKYTHYAPEAELVLVAGEAKRVLEKVNAIIGGYADKYKRIGIIASDETVIHYDAIAFDVVSAGSRRKMEDVAANLFRILRGFDERKTDIIFSECFPEEGIGRSVMDRLYKAAGGGAV